MGFPGGNPGWDISWGLYGHIMVSPKVDACTIEGAPLGYLLKVCLPEINWPGLTQASILHVYRGMHEQEHIVSVVA